MGLVIDSRALAQRLSKVFDDDVPNVAYAVRPRTDGRCVEWSERTPGGEVRHTAEPDTRAWQRALIHFLSLLPIEGLL